MKKMKPNSLLDSWCEIAKAELSILEFDIKTLSTQKSIVMAYFHAYLHLLIPSKPRNIIKSRQFSCPLHLQAGLCILEDKIKKGESIQPYLSRGTSSITNLDKLLFDWGIYHFHLGEKLIQNSKFIQRTGPVLFAILDELNVYFIDVMDHRNWSNLDLLETVDMDFPELLKDSSLGVIDVKPMYSSQDVGKLRKTNVNISIKLNSGNVVMSRGGGITRAGTSAKVSRELNYFYLMIGSTLAEIESTSIPVFHFDFLSKKYHVFDSNTNSYIFSRFNMPSLVNVI
jgi:hypothetical protein